MTIYELALNLIEHADTTPEEIDVSRAAEIIGWLDPDSGLPEDLTPEALSDAWNDIVRSSAYEDNWSPIEPENGYWYAVQRDREDDWSTGSYDREKALQIAQEQRNDYPDTLIAVIDNSGSNPVCIEEITEF